MTNLVAELSLKIGAVGGSISMDSLCEAPAEENPDLERDYLIAELDLLVETEVVGDLISAPSAALPGLTISTIAVLDLLERVPLLVGLLRALVESALDVTATVDVCALVDQPIPDDPNIALSLDLGGGSVVIDLAALLVGAHAGNVSEWLNNRAPNTHLFVDAGLPGDAVTSLLDGLVDYLLGGLRDLVPRIAAGGLLRTGLLIEGPLREFLEGGATAEFSLAGLPFNLGPPLNPLLSGIIDLVEKLVALFLMRHRFWLPPSKASMRSCRCCSTC